MPGEPVYDPAHRRVAPADEGPGNLSIAPTVARLFGLHPPEGGYDGQPLTDAFEPWALQPHTPCGAGSPQKAVTNDDDGPVGGETPAAAPAPQTAPQPSGQVPSRKGCKRFKSKRKRRACARKKKSV